MSQLQRPFTIPIQDVVLRLAQQKLAQRLKVFIAGPYISTEWTPEQIEEQGASTRLRLRLMSHIEDFLQHQIILGEHRGVETAIAEQFGEYGNAAVAEMALVDASDVIVMLPCSVGSFCEIGSWSSREDYCQKMIIVPEKRYENDESYFNKGTLRMAVSLGATVRWRDYEEPETVIEVVQEFVERAHARALMRRVNRGA